ncbi:MAG: hypothetical protein HQL71_07365 [Magnetococcales bacterium]|nr:hypothetical protein [Magnetococcales bacterium]
MSDIEHANDMLKLAQADLKALTGMRVKKLLQVLYSGFMPNKLLKKVSKHGLHPSK